MSELSAKIENICKVVTKVHLPCLITCKTELGEAFLLVKGAAIEASPNWTTCGPSISSNSFIRLSNSARGFRCARFPAAACWRINRSTCRFLSINSRCFSNFSPTELLENGVESLVLGQALAIRKMRHREKMKYSWSLKSNGTKERKYGNLKVWPQDFLANVPTAPYLFCLKAKLKNSNPGRGITWR